LLASQLGKLFFQFFSAEEHEEVRNSLEEGVDSEFGKNRNLRKINVTITYCSQSCYNTRWVRKNPTDNRLYLYINNSLTYSTIRFLSYPKGPTRGSFRTISGTAIFSTPSCIRLPIRHGLKNCGGRNVLFLGFYLRW